jgi:hypothetical protein
MRHIRVKILGKGDSVINVFPGYIVLRRRNGEVEIVGFSMEDGEARLNPDLKVTITYGNGTVEVVHGPAEKPKKRGRAKKNEQSSESGEDEIVTGTF